MYYLYHQVPEEMVGDVLYPLNTLKRVLPEVYKEQIQKYNNRAKLLKEKIYPLNCLWNDVIHLCAVNPLEIKKALQEVGVKWERRGYYQIESRSLEPSKTTVYLFQHLRELSEQDFAQYDPNSIMTYSVLPKETKRYYRRAKEKGDHIFTYHKIPHIFYKGEINVKGVSILTV